MFVLLPFLPLLSKTSLALIPLNQCSQPVTDFHSKNSDQKNYLAIEIVHNSFLEMILTKPTVFLVDLIFLLIQGYY